jgi:SM-20-related protein
MPSPGFFSSLGLYVADDFFDLALCERLRSEIAAANGCKGTVIRDGEEGVLDESSRRVSCANVSKTTSSLVGERLLAIQPKLEEHFQVSLAGFEPPDFLSYEEGAFYRPHRDASPGSPEYIQRRRVSVVTFLNKPSNKPAPGCYGGGALRFYGLMDGPEWEKCAFSLDAEPGLLIAFRSNVRHEVQPVTFGRRLSVVTWFLTDDVRSQ